jgi:hypothetical protein
MRLLHSLKVDRDEYFRQEESIHELGRDVQVRYCRPMIERNFSAQYKNEGRKVIVRVRDASQTRSESSKLPGSWIEERGGFERDEFGRYVFRDATLFQSTPFQSRAEAQWLHLRDHSYG